MTLKARLNSKFYIATCLLLCCVLFSCYGIYFLNANEILVGDDTPMSTEMKLLFTVLLSAVAISWIISLLTLIRQMITGSAFYMDEGGIHKTSTAIMIFAFIFIIPIKRIPYHAIKSISDENGILSIKFDKSQIEVFPLLRFFARSEYHFFAGCTKEKTSDIKSLLDQFVKNGSLC